MHRWSLLLAAPLLITLAGCVGETDDALPHDPDRPDPTAGMDEDTAASAGPPLLGPPVDLWGNTPELPLWEGSATALATCGWIPGTLDQIQLGCVTFALPAGTLVPEGTAALRFEADATAALRAGMWAPYIARTNGNTFSWGNDSLAGEPTGETSGTWRIPLLPMDWDTPQQKESAFRVGFHARGAAVNVLDGAITGRVVAERDPAWVPLAPIDHWQGGLGYRVPQAGAVTLLDHNTTWSYQAPLLDLVTPQPSPPVLRFLPIPVGTKALTLAVTWGTPDTCTERHDCAPNPSLRRVDAFPSPDAQVRGPGHLVRTYLVPDQLPPDGPYVGSSTVLVSPFVWRCAEDVPVVPCLASFYATGAAVDVRVVVEAWNTTPDVDGLLARLEVAA